MECRRAADWVAKRLEEGIRSLPAGFYGSFEFTTTGNNLTHPITWGLLARILWDFNGVATVGIDPRFNLSSDCKFQPDLVGLDSEREPVIFVDYESPNSSDARIPTKDIDAYLDWRKHAGHTAPYVIVTTLPDCRSSSWELRYTHGDRYNAGYHGRRAEIQENPCRFWYAIYEREMATRACEGLALVNISGTTVRRMFPA